MGDLASYHLSDFILFSANSYYRQFALYNQAIWPLHVVAMLFALVIVYALWKKPYWAGRVIAGLLVLGWVWVAIAFLYQRFYQIHVVANWYAFGFVLQAGLMSWFGIIKNCFNVFQENRLRLKAAAALLWFALMAYVFIPVFTGRSWLQFEMFALAPDPTVLGTLAILWLYKAPGLLYVIPVSWVVISATTLLVM